MSETVQQGLIQAAEVARQTETRRAANGVRYANYGETQLAEPDLTRMVQAVPPAVASALTAKAYYFVPLALAEARSEGRPENRPDGHRGAQEETLIASAYTVELGDEAICHRNVALGDTEGVFISTRVLNDRFALAFEFFINVGHAFVEHAGVPENFATLASTQAGSDARGETSQDAWESRTAAFSQGKPDGKLRVDEKARLEFLQAAFADAIAIYLLSLTVDFDYSELREREYPLLAPAALADRLRLIAGLFPPNPGYEFSIRYRRRSDR